MLSSTLFDIILEVCLHFDSRGPHSTFLHSCLFSHNVYFVISIVKKLIFE